MLLRSPLFISVWSALMLVVLLFPAGAGAQPVPISDLPPSPWSPPVKISGDTRAAWWPTIAVDDAGTVHIVWNASFTDTPVYENATSVGAAPADAPGLGTSERRTHTVSGLFYARADADGWTEPNDIALIWAGHALRSSLTVDPGGRLHLLYKGFGQLVPDKLDPPRSLGPQDIWYTASDVYTADSVGSWSSPNRLSRSTEGYYSDVAIDHNGVIHVIWTESDQGTWLIYYSHSSDGGATWSDRLALQDSGLVWWYRAHLVVDAQDRVHVTWENTDSQHLASTREAVYALSTDGGNTFSKARFAGLADPSAASRVGPGPQQPTIGVDGRGRILLVFREPTTNRIMYMQSIDGLSWSSPEPIPGIRAAVPRPYDSYDMVTDGAGHVHLATVAFLEGSSTMALLHSDWDGASWGRPDVITGSPFYPEYPKLALGGGNRLHASWFIGDKPGIERAPLSVWYSSRPISAPSSTRVGGVPVPVPPKQAPLATAPRPSAPQLPPALLDDDRNAVLPVSTPNWLTEARRQPGFPIFVALIPILVVLGLVVSLKLGLFKR